ncbi:MAG: proline dehydrogenase, partial [Actinomycetota bacterium]|nr:proline dehydrogenase [Actinomycetota bacterium]
VSGPSASVLRPAVLGVAGHPWFRWFATKTPPGRAVALRFVAGETLDAAMAVARELDRGRVTAMLDHLGENVATLGQADVARDDYLAALAAIGRAPGLDCAISVKLTQLGLDASVAHCLERVWPILETAAETGTQVMIDMESHLSVDGTLQVLHAAFERYPMTGICLQAYLKRTVDDIFELPRGVRVRLVKGAYLEPPDLVYTAKEEVNRRWAELFATLLARGHQIDAATHDPALVEGVRRLVDPLDAGWSRVEFQMLYGVRRDLQAQLARQGYPIRVYVPYGTEWYPYLTRRLAERPANMWFFFSNLVRRG